MSIPAGKQIDIYSIKDRLRKTDKEAYQLVKALEFALERQQDLTKLAISKLKNLKTEK